MNANEIEQIVNELLKVKDKLTREELDTTYFEFRTRNQLFYETILNGSFEPVVFKEMMKRKRELESGRDQYSVDVKFGKFMAERYIDPVINKDKKD
jgi:hypothetical protein